MHTGAGTTIAEMEHPEAYVRRMVVNEFLSWRRKWARYVPYAEVDPDAREPDYAEAQAERSALLAQVGKLPRRQRAVLVLRYYEGLSDAQIARLLGCAETTVRGYAFRGLAAFRIEMTSNARQSGGRAMERDERAMSRTRQGPRTAGRTSAERRHEQAVHRGGSAGRVHREGDGGAEGRGRAARRAKGAQRPGLADCGGCIPAAAVSQREPSRSPIPLVLNRAATARSPPTTTSTCRRRGRRRAERGRRVRPRATRHVLTGAAGDKAPAPAAESVSAICRPQDVTVTLQ